MVKTIILKNSKELARKGSELIIKQVKKKPNSVLCLATGKTMIPIYKEIVKQTKRKKIDWSNVRTFNLDEYANSNQFKNFMNKHLFNHINIKKENTNFPSNKFKEYENKIKKSKGINLCILGIGRNGHIAFNEPGSSFKSLTRKVKFAEGKRHAYTIGIKTIMKSRKIILFASGKNKSEIIKKTLKEKISKEIPASILRKHKNTTFIIDKSTASKLK